MKVACLLLAAGKSRRMAGANKLLLELDGKTVLERTCSALAAAPFSSYVAVTGFEATEVADELALFPQFRVVHNPAFDVGMHSSIRVGVYFLEECDYFAVCLADQPFLTAADYDALISAAAGSGLGSVSGAPLIYPVIDGERGQPVLISAALRSEILAHPDDDRGCQYLFKRHRSMAVDLTHSASAFAFYDVDTPEAFAHARHSLIGDADGKL